MAEVGRPTKMTDDVIRKIEEVAALDGTVEEMAFYANIHKDTIYSWLKEDKKFSDRIADLRQRPFLKARQEVIKGLNNYQNAMDYLKRKKRKEFGDSVDLTSGNKPIPILGGKSNEVCNDNSGGETAEIKEAD
jgi:hypothetical protein